MLGWYASRFETLHEVENNSVHPVRYADANYPLINPLVSVAIPDSTGFPELKGVKHDVQTVIDAARRKGNVSDVGVYFRLPDNAHWFGINENGKFDPGSLIKVPIMLAYLKEAETRPSILDTRLYYDPAGKSDPLPNALPAQLPRGSYNAARLLQAMIVDSDNAAKDILVDHIAPAALQHVFDETSSNFLKDPSGTISPKQYIIILSRIYSATYLNRYYSNYAMDLLTKTTFQGLALGLPKDVRLADKYGERGVYEDKLLIAVELHDCGLVYADTPYYLCVMTKGTDMGMLTGLIRDISSAVYKDRGSFAP